MYIARKKTMPSLSVHRLTLYRMDFKKTGRIYSLEAWGWAAATLSSTVSPCSKKQSHRSIYSCFRARDDPPSVAISSATRAWTNASTCQHKIFRRQPHWTSPPIRPRDEFKASSGPYQGHCDSDHDGTGKRPNSRSCLTLKHPDAS